MRESLQADGSSRDLELRDSLGYHGSALRPPMQLAILAGEQGRELYTWQSVKDDSRNRCFSHIMFSDDDGQSWPVERVLHEGPAAYSCLATLPGGTIACLFEGGKDDWRKKIVLARFNLAWLGDTR